MNWTHGYHTGTGYTFGHYPVTSPTHIAWCALSKSHIVNIEKFRYLELGCGQGFNLIIHAINHPSAHFLGIDFLPEHIQHANLLKERLGLNNIEFLELDFKDFNSQISPKLKFEYIVAHGISTWVSSEIRKAISEIVDQNLALGGIFLNSYNTPHYWQFLQSFQHLASMLDAHGISENPVERAVRIFESINNLRPDYFNDHRILSEKLKALKFEDKNYLNHEFLNKNWRLIFFHEEYKINTAIKLNYLCTSSLIEEYSEHFPSELMSNFQNQSIDLQTTLKDTFLSKAFRTDLWIKGRPQSSDNEIREVLSQIVLYKGESKALSNEDEITVNYPPIQIKTKNKLSKKILDSLEKSPVYFDSIKDEVGAIREFFRVCSLLFEANKIRIGFKIQSKIISEDKNDEIMRQSIVDKRPYKFIAAPSIGSSIPINLEMSLFRIIRAETMDAENSIEAALKILKSISMTVQKEGKTLTDSELRIHLETELKKYPAFHSWMRYFGAIN